MSAHLELVDEVRPGRGWYFFNSGERVAEHARLWAAELAELVRAHGGGNLRLALDKADQAGVAALVGRRARAARRPGGDGARPREQGADEIKAMRCALATCEAAMGAMQAAAAPGHQRAGAVGASCTPATSRAAASGSRPACSPRARAPIPGSRSAASRAIEAGDLVGFDTDLIGPYGYCADISRTWLCGERRAARRQRELYRLAREQIAYNLALIRPGLGFRELSEKAFRLPERFRANRYSVIAHGVGLCDEYPAIYYPEDAAATGYDGVLEAGMTICIESYVGAAGGAEGVKLEQQLLVTADRLRGALGLPVRGRRVRLRVCE